MITDGKEWHYLAVEKLPSLLRGITSKHNGDHLEQRINLRRMRMSIKNMTIVIQRKPGKAKNILKYRLGENFMKFPFVIYPNTEFLLEKVDTYHNDLEKSSTTEVIKHTTYGYSLLTQCSFDNDRNKHDYYRGKNCMKIFCKDLKECVMKITNFE